jgi:hypothetical protein
MQPRDGHSERAELAPGLEGLDVTAARRRAPARPRTPSERDLVATVLEAARTDWRAAAFVLERRFPERWLRRSAVDEAAAAPRADSLDELAGRRAQRRGSK